jgi:hypothetical protein
MVDLCRACNGNASVEYEQPKNVMLGLQMAFEGFGRKAGATDVTINPTTLRGCCAPRPLASIFRFCRGNLYLPWHADHDFCLVGIRQEADSLKQLGEDVKGRLQPHRASRGDQPVIHKKGDTLIAHSISNSLPSDVVPHHLMELLPYDTIDKNIEHEAGESPPLRNTLIGSKGLTIIAPIAQHTIFASSQNCSCRQSKFGPTP